MHSFLPPDKDGESWTLENAGPVLLTPADFPIEREILKLLPADIQSADQMDPERDGLSFVEVQRQHRVVVPGLAEPMIATAAFAQLTSIFPDRIVTKLLKEWPTEWGPT